MDLIKHLQGKLPRHPHVNMKGAPGICQTKVVSILAASVKLTGRKVSTVREITRSYTVEVLLCILQVIRWSANHMNILQLVPQKLQVRNLLIRVQMYIRSQ